MSYNVSVSGMGRQKECHRQRISDVSAACSFSRISANHHGQCELDCARHCNDCQTQLNAASASSWRDLMVDRFGFLETPVFDRKDSNANHGNRLRRVQCCKTSLGFDSWLAGMKSLHKARSVQRGAQDYRSRIKL